MALHKEGEGGVFGHVGLAEAEVLELLIEHTANHAEGFYTTTG